MASLLWLLSSLFFFRQAFFTSTYLFNAFLSVVRPHNKGTISISIVPMDIKNNDLQVTNMFVSVYNYIIIKLCLSWLFLIGLQYFC